MHRLAVSCAAVVLLWGCEASGPPKQLAQVRIVDLETGKRIDPVPVDDTDTTPSPDPGTPVPEKPAADVPAAVDHSPHVALGVPHDSDPSDDLLLDRGAFVVSYNGKRRVSNWVAWKLVAADIGKLKRTDKWLVDDELPADVFKAKPEDYTKSGFDRGHLCPSADRTASAQQNALTFLMTNVLPQRNELNAGPWEKLEELERELAVAKGKDVYIVAGGIFSPSPPVIGRALHVPNDFFKVIVAVDAGKGPADVGDDALVFAAIMPNITGIQKKPWTDYSTTIASVEKASGYDFDSRVPQSAQHKLEQRQDVQSTAGAAPTPPPTHPKGGGGKPPKKKKGK